MEAPKFGSFGWYTTYLLIRITADAIGVSRTASDNPGVCVGAFIRKTLSLFLWGIPDSACLAIAVAAAGRSRLRPALPLFQGVRTVFEF